MPQRSPDATADRGFERFYEAHHPAVLAYCRRRLGPQAAEDASAEVFAAAWRKWSAVPDGDGALPWLYGTAHREVLHQWRSMYRYRRLVDRARRLGKPAPTGPDHVVVEGVEVELARQALLRLSRRDQEVLRLALWEELTYTEIAVVLGLTDQAVGMRFMRAKRRFGEQYRTVERRHVSNPSRRGKGGDR